MGQSRKPNFEKKFKNRTFYLFKDRCWVFLLTSQAMTRRISTNLDFCENYVIGAGFRHLMVTSWLRPILGGLSGKTLAFDCVFYFIQLSLYKVWKASFNNEGIKKWVKQIRVKQQMTPSVSLCTDSGRFAFSPMNFILLVVSFFVLTIPLYFLYSLFHSLWQIP